MNRWQSILMGLVLSALLGVAIALAVSDERRRQLSHRLEELRKALPRMEQLKQSAQEERTPIWWMAWETEGNGCDRARACPMKGR
jgi:hypothetical protein